MIITTKPYNEAEIKSILEIRCQEEDVEITDEAKDLLTQIGVDTSLRYAMHLITAAHLVAQKRKSNEVDTADISRVYSLFIDIERSKQFLKEYEQEFLYSEIVKKEGSSNMEIDK